MNLALFLLIVFAVLLFVLLAAVLRGPRRLGKPDAELAPGEESERRHVTYFPQVRQAMSEEDFAFLSSVGSRGLSRRVRKDRRRIVLSYLSCVRRDFQKLWRLARVIASLSPRVGMAQEIVRLRLGMGFYLRYELVRVKFLIGFSPVPELGTLSEAVSRMAIRLETAMRDLGERAALAAKLASTLDGRDLNTP